MRNITTKRGLGVSVVLSSLFLASFIAPAVPSAEKDKVKKTNAYSSETTEDLQNSKENFENPFKQIKITANSAAVWDIKNQEFIYELNANKPLPLASITKMITAITAFDLIPLNTEIKIEKEFLEVEGDTGLYLDERWTAKDLIEFSLITSSNDGARAIASTAGSIKIGLQDYEMGREYFIEEMNKKISELGLKSITVKNESGLDEENESESSAYGSAREIALLFEKILNHYSEVLDPTVLSEATFTSLSGISHQVKNTNITNSEIPGIIASKTGYTTLAGGNLAIIFDAGLGRPIVVVVLGSTFDERFDDIKKLVEASRKYVRKTSNSLSN